LIIVIKQGMSEDYYVIGATAPRDCFGPQIERLSLLDTWKAHRCSASRKRKKQHKEKTIKMAQKSKIIPQMLELTAEQEQGLSL
jgi:hypothetical protein